ncbi:molybdopterin cofactor-binding domain-containing protein [Palleronia sp. KMU-117]|uniref:xanthine dehydrogenase family protein molybdopterin-binding subunit n=1 Tax=Palleronia sp. KMU-117 TaxID=3434108 RepID=UPI003D73F84B
MNAPKLPAPLETAPRIADWLAVSPDGAITILTGRVELGQGSLTAIRQIAADELNCDPEQLEIHAADTGATPDEGFTAGSVSIPLGGGAVRWAAAALRQAILQAAAARIGGSADDLAFEDGQISRDGVPTGVTLGELAGALDLARPVAELGRPKPAGARWSRGRDVGGRIDLRARMVGAPFVHDLEMPGMLHGRPVHPPAPGAELLDLDLDALKARPGVVEVVRDGSFVGVIAETPHAAVRAAQWARANGRWSSGAVAPNDEMQVIAASEEPASVSHSAGDVAAAEGEVFETEVSRPYLFHGSIGPSAAVAEWEGDEIRVWTHSQGVYQLREAFAMALDLPEDRFRVIHTPGAGCYGHNSADDAAFDAVLMARAVPGRPVKVVWARIDEFRTGPMGPGMVTRAKATVGPDGRIAAVEVVVNSAPHANRPGRNGAPNLAAAPYLADPRPHARSTDIPLARGGAADRNAVPYYTIPNVEVTKRLVHLLPYRTSSLRALGAYANVFAIETLMDDIAVARGEDPVAFRLRHLDDPRARDVIERTVELAAPLRGTAEPDGAGWGIGFSRYKNFSGYCAVLARVSVDEDVRVTDVISVSDIGEVVSPDGARNQIEGGIVQAISWATKEAVPFEGAGVAVESWLDYPVLRFSEVPRLKVEIIERMDQPPLGAGEISQGPTVAAVGNAVRAALGVRVRKLPLNRASIFEALV